MEGKLTPKAEKRATRSVTCARHGDSDNEFDCNIAMQPGSASATIAVNESGKAMITACEDGSNSNNVFASTCASLRD